MRSGDFAVLPNEAAVDLLMAGKAIISLLCLGGIFGGGKSEPIQGKPAVKVVQCVRAAQILPLGNLCITHVAAECRTLSNQVLYRQFLFYLASTAEDNPVRRPLLSRILERGTSAAPFFFSGQTSRSMFCMFFVGGAGSTGCSQNNHLKSAGTASRQFQTRQM